MSAPDPRTATRHYPKTDPTHYASDDAVRIAQAVEMIDADVDAVTRAAKRAKLLALALGN